MKIAVIGAGVAGLMAARQLHKDGHQVTVYEASDGIGGHARTHHFSFPAELGVFMHEPTVIHPTMCSLAKELGVDYAPISLTFSFEFAKEIAWSSVSSLPPRLRDLGIVLKTWMKSLGTGKAIRNARYIAELGKFFHHLPNHQAKGQSLQDYAASCSPDLLNYWLLPHMHCWWGIPRQYAPQCSIDVIFDSMLQVATLPQYIFVNGWNQFLDALTSSFRSSIQLNHTIQKVSRAEGKVDVDGMIYDHVVFATPPSVVNNLLQDATLEEKSLFQSYTTTSTTVYLHRDTSWMPQKEKWATINYMVDQRGSLCTFWCGDLFPQKEHIFVSWTEGNDKPDQIEKEMNFLRTLPTMSYTKSCHDIRHLQGSRGVWYCGAHVHALGENRIPSLWHENALLSGIQVAQNIAATAK